jgi:hypothetical protein
MKESNWKVNDVLVRFFNHWSSASKLSLTAPHMRTFRSYAATGTRMTPTRPLPGSKCKQRFLRYLLITSVGNPFSKCG